MQIEDRNIQIRSLIIIVLLALIAITVGAQRSSAQSATNVYISQSGGGSGTSCASALPVTWFNASSSWGGAGGQIGPGTIVHLCGTITTTLSVQGSGNSTNVIEVLWENGARVSMANSDNFELNGHSYLLFEGGSPCGPNTSCSTTDTGTGIIEDTANGSALANQTAGVCAFNNSSGSGNIEIRDLIIRNIYQHTSMSDTTNSVDVETCVYVANTLAGNLSAHDNTIHDVGTAFQLEFFSNSPTVNIYDNYIYNDNWAVGYSGNGPRTLNLHDNHFGSTANWDTTADAFHHNGLHSYMNVSQDSIATNFYNNLSDGNWGSCCTTDTMIYEENNMPNNFYIYNNVEIQYPGNLAPAFQISGHTGSFTNNTILGSATTPSNSVAVMIGGTNMTVENNAIEGYGQYLVIGSGTTFAAFDHNYYGALGMSGNAPWSFAGTAANNFSQWVAACSCDANGGNPSHLNVSSTGALQAGSTLIGGAANLTSMNITPFDSDTTDGDTRTPSLRPASTPWDAGAFQFGTVANQPAPPMGLSATVN